MVIRAKDVLIVVRHDELVLLRISAEHAVRVARAAKSETLGVHTIKIVTNVETG